jgi:repressor LexA
LTPAQEKVYQRLLEHNRRTGALPDLSGFARSMGIHYVSLKQHLDALERKGYIEFESRGRGRSPHIALPSRATGVPVLGDIPAGTLDAAFAHPEAYLALPNLDASTFALEVRGDSMADLIQPGDLVLLSRRDTHRNGEICAVRVDEDDVTLKYLYKSSSDAYELRAHNPAYEPMVIAARRLSIDGVYRGLLRGDAAGVLLEPN